MQGFTFHKGFFKAGGEKCRNFVEALNPATMTESGKKRILLVDDHIDTINAVRVLLERRGYEVETANTVTAAKAVFYSGDFDLLISDIGLPDGTGHELLNHITSDRPIRAIALSGYGTDQDIKNSREAGFADHLTKPFNFKHLHEVIERLLNDLPVAVGGTLHL
jgi:CheY-like chemotaxis protein